MGKFSHKLLPGPTIPAYAPFCGQQEEPSLPISRLSSRMRRMYVASIRLDFH